MAKKTVADWVAKGWTRLDLTADTTVDIAYEPTTQDLVLKGQRFGADGDVLKGRDRAQLTTDETDSGCSIAASDDVTVLYKIVTHDDDDEGDSSAAG